MPDAHGRAAPLLDPARMGGSVALQNRRGRRVIWRAALELAAGSPVRILVYGIGGMALVYAGFYVFAVLLNNVLAVVVVVAATIALGVLTRPSLYRPSEERRRRAERQLLRFGVCPSCVYDLVGVESDGDNRVTCPECGAVWASRLIHRTEPLVEDATDAWSFTEAIRPGNLEELHFARDDRGWRVPVLSERPGEIAAQASDPSVRERLVHADAAARKATRIERLVVGWFLVAIFGPAAPIAVAGFIFGLWQGVISVTSPVIVPALGMVAAPIVMLVIGIGELRGKTTLRRRRARHHLTAAGFCASCGTDISSADPEPDGCTVCPECEAAWRIGADGSGAATSRSDVP